VQKSSTHSDQAKQPAWPLTSALGLQIMHPRIMYIELKTDGLRGVGRIGRVKFSKTGNTLYYQDRTLVRTKGAPLKANYYDEETLEDFWVSGPKKDGRDSLFSAEIEIDEEVRSEYWAEIRNLPNNISQDSYKSPGKSKAEKESIEKGLRRRQMDNGWMPN